MSFTDFSTKYKPSDYKSNDKLYRGFNIDDLVQETNEIDVNSIRFPDFSCNWSRFSKPKDIRNRENATSSDGCYSFSVKVSQFNNMATPCHDPIKDENNCNFSHTEIRQLKQEENIDFEPPKKRKLNSNNWKKSQKLKYRNNIKENMKIEIDIGEQVN